MCLHSDVIWCGCVSGTHALEQIVYGLDDGFSPKLVHQQNRARRVRGRVALTALLSMVSIVETTQGQE